MSKLRSQVGGPAPRGPQRIDGGPGSDCLALALALALAVMVIPLYAIRGVRRWWA